MKSKVETVALIILISILIVLGCTLPAVSAVRAKDSAAAYTTDITVIGSPSFQRYVRQALAEAEDAGYGHFIAINIARIQPEGPAYFDVGGHLMPNTNGARGTAYLQEKLTPLVDWLWLAILEEAVHQSQINNGHLSCGRLAEYTAAWVRQVAAESAGLNERPLRDWASIPEFGGCP